MLVAGTRISGDDTATHEAVTSDVSLSYFDMKATEPMPVRGRAILV
jgi:hypothetical protein